MMPPNLLRDAAKAAGQLIQGHDPVKDEALPKGYPEGCNALFARHLSEVVEQRVLRPIERCRAWIDPKVDVAEFDRIMGTLTNANDGLCQAAHDNRDGVVQIVDEMLNELHATIAPLVS